MLHWGLTMPTNCHTHKHTDYPSHTCTLQSPVLVMCSLYCQRISYCFSWHIIINSETQKEKGIITSPQQCLTLPSACSETDGPGLHPASRLSDCKNWLAGWCLSDWASYFANCLSDQISDWHVYQLILCMDGWPYGWMIMCWLADWLLCSQMVFVDMILVINQSTPHLKTQEYLSEPSSESFSQTSSSGSGACEREEEGT